MVYIPSGMKISELIAELKAMKEAHGDVEVYSGGTDYPSGVKGIKFVPEGEGDGYIPDNSVAIG